jgi:protein-L-isoaspartate(D-aspartate) O-methyltransferase
MSMSQVAEFAREQMVAQQIRAWDVLDEDILNLFRRLPRESFAPAAYRDVAYADMQIPLPQGQHMLAPSVAGRILQALDVQPGENVLEAGTGSGFLSACFALQGARVSSLEIHADLAEQARLNLAAVGIQGVTVTHADFFSQLASAGRYDAIAVTGSLPLYDSRIEALLKPDGRLFVVVGEGAAMEARLITRSASGERRQNSLFETVLDPLAHAPRAEHFRF